MDRRSRKWIVVGVALSYFWGFNVLAQDNNQTEEGLYPVHYENQASPYNTKPKVNDGNPDKQSNYLVYNPNPNNLVNFVFDLANKVEKNEFLSRVFDFPNGTKLTYIPPESDPYYKSDPDDPDYQPRMDYNPEKFIPLYYEYTDDDNKKIPVLLYFDKASVQPWSQVLEDRIQKESSNCSKKIREEATLQSDALKVLDQIKSQERKRCESFEKAIQQKNSSDLKTPVQLSAYFNCYLPYINKKEGFSRKFLKRYDQEYKHYLDVTAAQFQIPSPIFKCMAFQESDHWRANRSKTGPRGLMQIGGDAAIDIVKSLRKGTYHKEITEFNRIINEKNKCIASDTSRPPDTKYLSSFPIYDFLNKDLKRDEIDPDHPPSASIGAAVYLSELKNKDLISRIQANSRDSFSTENQKWLVATAFYNQGPGGLDEIMEEVEFKKEKRKFNFTQFKDKLRECVKRRKCDGPLTKCLCKQVLAHVESIANCSLKSSPAPSAGDTELAGINDDNSPPSPVGCIQKLTRRYENFKKLEAETISSSTGN